MDTVFYVFLVIFCSTWLLWLLSFVKTNSINIPEWYRKKIFIAIVAEVASAIIFLFYYHHTTNKVLEKAKVVSENINWISYENGNHLSPKVKIIANDNTYLKEFKANTSQNKILVGRKTDTTKLNIYSQQNDFLGYIKRSNLSKIGFFNDLKSTNKKIETNSHYKFIKWTKQKKAWKRNNYFIEPFEFNIYDSNLGTFYRIINTISNDTLYDSKDVKEKKIKINHIDEDDRINHFIEYQNKFYLFRITHANLEDSGKKYVHVLILKIEPQIKVK